MTLRRAVESPKLWLWVRVLGGPAILAVLAWRLGTGPFLDGINEIDGWSLAAAAGIGVLTTVCCAWRWTLVARALGVRVPLGGAVAAYYRSQFLNTTLPGGVLGDLDRGMRHGHASGDVGRGLRAVGWERSAGLFVQVVVAAGLLLLLPSPVQPLLPVVVVVLVAAGLAVALLSRVLPQQGPGRLVRAMRAVTAELRVALLTRRAWPGILLASAVVVAGHTATFLIAMRTAGITAPTAEILPLGVLALLAMGLPMNIGGWGPREGVAAWAFGAAGLGAAQGVAAAVVYGVMALVATVPGAVVMLAAAFRAVRHRSSGVDPARRQPAGSIGGECVTHG
jgi:uncharacterized membrane protein YbhN (UPF0104 family)